MNVPYRRSVITDEISQDLDRAIALACEFGLEGIDIRTVWDTRVDLLTDDQITRVKSAASAAGLAIAGIAPPFMKCLHDSDAEWREHRAILDRSLRVAEAFGARFVRGFTFWKQIEPLSHWDRIVGAYREVTPMIERSGLIVAIENEPACMLGTTDHLPRLLRDIGSPNVKALWDPANGAHDGERPVPTAFDRVMADTVHVHLKDGRHVDGKWEHAIVGEGAVGLVDLSRALASIGYDGWVTLETHYRPRKTGADLNRPGGASLSELGEEGTRACLEGWARVLAAA
ncbi:MAG: sugar phosphate isomerase/epimerase [Chloroflexota bacterium]|nr:MAG: sugar phosphate isomerase/epimerase [Chloroflexota bacterium]